MRLHIRVMGLVAVGAVVAVASAAPGAGAGAGGAKTVTQRDAPDAVGLDLDTVALGRAADGRLRARISLHEPWEAGDLLAADGGRPGALCVKLWTRRIPGADPPDWLVCVTARDAQTLRASVLREPTAGVPRKVAAAKFMRPSARSVVLLFSQSSVRRPDEMRFAGEAARADCTRASGCADIAPNSGRTRLFRLR